MLTASFNKCKVKLKKIEEKQENNNLSIVKLPCYAPQCSHIIKNIESVINEPKINKLLKI
jgi:hypothetical protein